LGYHFVDLVITFFSKPVGRFVYLQPTEAFFVRLKIALGAGIILAMPVVIFQIWRFVVVALTPLEKKALFWILPVSYGLFVLGISFGFFVVVPAGIKFLLSYSSEVLVATISIGYYVNFVGTICLVLGVVSQLPLASFFSSRLGLIDSQWLTDKRRIVILVIYLASALLTPGPDPVTAVLLAIPTYLVYEISIITARWGRQK